MPDAAIIGAADAPTDAATDAPTVAVAPPPPLDPPPRRPARQPDRPARPNGPPGTITIDSSPIYATIYVDGKRIGDTPLVKLELAPGRHVVRAVTESGASQELRVMINAGENSSPCRFSW